MLNPIGYGQQILFSPALNPMATHMHYAYDAPLN